MSASGLIAKLVERTKRRLSKPSPPKTLMTGSLAGRVGFAIGTGRCGTHFIAKLFEYEPEIAAFHERDPLLENFHRYCKWYGLPVDDEGFLHTIESRIRGDLSDHALSFESSPSLGLSVTALDERFAPKFVLLVRNPRDVVKSYLQKGWYEKPIVQRRPELALGYQETAKFRHFLGRIVPRGDDLAGWTALSRVGKVSWFWTAMNRSIIDMGARVSPDRWRMYKLESFGFDEYQNLGEFLNIRPRLTRAKFDEIRESKPGKKKPQETAPWTGDERREFEAQVSVLAAELGYPLSND